MRRLICELPLGPYRIALFETDEPIENGEWAACWSHCEMSITLDAALSGIERWAVLFHELTHAVSDIYHLEIDDEHVCAAIGTGMAQALAKHLPEPPRSVPPVPQFMEDESTPTIAIRPITTAEEMP